MYQQYDKHGAADDRHDYAHRQFIRSKEQSCRQIAHADKAGTDNRAKGKELSAFPSDKLSYKMRNDKPDKAEQSRKADRRSCEKRSGNTVLSQL